MILNIDQTKCRGCGICVHGCAIDTLRLDTNREEVPPCSSGCPAGVDIRGYMYLLRLGDLINAIRVMREALPLPAITGRVCFHPCETECARKEVDEAMNINAIERSLADYWLKEKAEPMPRQHVTKAAIIGSGPAGLACAYFLTRMGYRVTVFESMAEPGGMLRIGIPGYRLPKDIVNSQINYIRDMGVEFRTNTTIGKDLNIDSLKNMGYKAVFLAIGAQLSRKLKIDGDDLDGVLWGLEFLRDANSKRGVKVKGKVLVIGGGDVAMDAALCALRLGAKEVEMACLESREEMPAHEENLKLALDEGVSLNVSWGPKQILGKDRKVAEIELVRCTSVFDKDSRFSPCFDEKVTKSIKADMVIFAIGQASDLSFLPKQVRTTDGTIAVDPITLETTLPGVFAGGDAVLGPASVVESIAAGKRAAISIDRYLMGKDLKANRDGEVKKVEQPPKERIEQKTRGIPSSLPIDQRVGSFREVKTGFSEKMMVIEADRCMTCGSKAYIAHPEDCMTCFNCEIKCPYEAVDVHPFKEVLPYAIKYPVGGEK